MHTHTQHTCDIIFNLSFEAALKKQNRNNNKQQQQK